jgi:hypothetical protein
MNKQIENDLLYESELNAFVHLPDGSERIGDLIRIRKIKRLRLGRKTRGTKIDVKKGIRVPAYKVTAFRLLFGDDLELNISPFLYRQLKKREKLPVEIFNYLG